MFVSNSLFMHCSWMLVLFDTSITNFATSFGLCSTSLPRYFKFDTTLGILIVICGVFMPEIIRIYVSKTSLVSSTSSHVLQLKKNTYVFLAIGHYTSKFLYYNHVCIKKTNFAVLWLCELCYKEARPLFL